MYMPTARNQVVRYATILSKGGAHTKAVSGQRYQLKRQLYDEIDEYFNPHEDEDLIADQRSSGHRKLNKGRSKSAPFSFGILVPLVCR